MGIEKIFLIILIVVIFVFSVSFILYLFFKPDDVKKYESVVFLDLDLDKWRIRINDLSRNIFSDKGEDNNFIFGKEKVEGWVSLSTVFKFIGPKNEQNWKKAIEYCVQNNSSYQINHFEHIEKEENEYAKKLNNLESYILKFQFISDYKLRVECKLSDKQKIRNNAQSKIVSKAQIINDHHKYNLFISFLLKDNVSSTFENFVNLLDEKLGKNNYYYFKSNSIASIFYANNSYNEILRNRKKVQRVLKRSLGRNNINNYFEALTYTECNDVMNESDFIKVVNRIFFGLVKSKLQNEPYLFSLNNIQFNEFETFKEKINLINKEVKSTSKDIKKIEVRSIKTNKEIYEYWIPNFEMNNDDFWNEYIIKFNGFDDKIRDRFIENILESQPSTRVNKKRLVLVNDYYVKKVFDKMEKHKKNFIFIINISKSKNTLEFIRLLKLLELSKINYGIYIKKFDGSIHSIISNTNPQLILLSAEFNSNFEKNDLRKRLKVIDSVVISNKKNIDLIFSNINKNIRDDIKSLSKGDKYYIQDDGHFFS